MHKKFGQFVQIDRLGRPDRYYDTMDALDPGKTISPRDLAKAIGMSESSLKRWADRGLLSVTRTAGGHRRIRVKDAIRFVRDRKLIISTPGALGLPGAVSSGIESGQTSLTPESPVVAASCPFTQLLERGQGELAEAYLVGRFLAGDSIAGLGDQVIRPALEQLGHGPHGAEEILREHRATQVCMQAIEQMRALSRLETPGFRAVGGGAAGSTYMLPSQLVAALVEESGGRAVNLGANTPIRALRCEAFTAEQDRGTADLVWLSVSEPLVCSDEKAALTKLISDCAEARIHLMLGGRAVSTLAVDGDSSSYLTLHQTLEGMFELVQAAFSHLQSANNSNSE